MKLVHQFKTIIELPILKPWIIPLVISGIKSGFDQPRNRTYSKLEELIVKAANKDIKEEMKLIIDFYRDNFSEGQLAMQLEVLSCNIPDSSSHNFSSVLQYLRSQTSPQQALMPEECTHAALIAVMPATNAASERSFSCLRRVKSYLKSTMT